jgi:hypothetical protein
MEMGKLKREHGISTRLDEIQKKIKNKKKLV